mmetsp:Transcript_26280/g.89874  ORF Transcript_26280/g.89874 Transcript_26280/m.89874 type:complete len:229 (-) Transcript_26280:431-1117(-)
MASSYSLARSAPKKSSGWLACASSSLPTSSAVNPSSSSTVSTMFRRSSRLGSHLNLHMRPSRSSGAYSEERSFAVTMMGTRRTTSSSRHSSPTLTLVGSSHRFISVPITICWFTVTCVSLNRPAPASRSLMTRQLILPWLRTTEAALRYRSRMSLPGRPAHSSSSSPADMIMGSMPIFLQQSSTWKLFPHPFAPHTPRMRGTLVPCILSARKLDAMWSAKRSMNAGGM